MTSLLDLGSNSQVAAETISAGDTRFVDGDGNSTATYNNSGAGSTANTTLLQTQLGRVDEVIVTIKSDGANPGTGATVGRGIPAQEQPEGGDNTDAVDQDNIGSYVILELYDASDNTEIADDTDVTGLDLEVVAIRR